jgi:serine/threonine protein kinase
MQQKIIGKILGGRYRVEQFIDQGGMASVYRVLDLQTGTPLAMKVLKPDLAEDTVFLRRFSREATVLQRLEHPNIVRFFGFEVLDGNACLLLEYIDGITLRRRIFESASPFSIEETRSWLLPVCEALSYAHELGVYHCDIKPANIMVTCQGRVVLSDFGIARTAGGTVTTMSTPGTPDFMAPEQWLGHKVDARSDLYALAITLYSMLTRGERPFKGDSPQSEGDLHSRVQWEHLFLPPPAPDMHNTRINAGLSSMILKALAKNPDDRFQTAGEFYQAFEESASGHTFYPAPSPVQSPPLSVSRPSTSSTGRVSNPVASPGIKWGIFAMVAGMILVTGLVVALGIGAGNGASPPQLPALLTYPISPSPVEVEATAGSFSLPVQTQGIFVEYIVSSANSMMQTISGQSKQALVRQALTQHWNTLGSNIPGVNVGLRVYGSRYNAAEIDKSCRDTELLSNPSATAGQSASNLVNLLAGTESRGLAPLAETLYAAAGDFSLSQNNAIFLVVDSSDTCGGDPCTWANTQYGDAGLKLPIYVFDLGGNSGLECLANASDGIYHPITDYASFQAALTAGMLRVAR